ncbi:MAG TPA: 5-(carboxyamino)imidazole ribonucleotide synthase [Thermodesulfobacteriota bacterium]|jgi:5-(carboxyamino)imidazole ribonucleotide synthase
MHTKNSFKSKTIGIIGGGQLARMTALAAYRIGLQVAILDPESGSPAGQIAHLQLVGSLNDISMLEELARASDLITLENEFVDAPLLKHLESIGIPVLPTAHTVGLIQDKLLQKLTLEESGIGVPHFMGVSTPDDVYKAGKDFGWPLLLKTRRNGYDGRGNVLIKEPNKVHLSLRTLEGTKSLLMVEAFIPFRKEIAVMVARNNSGEIVTYSVAETIQKDHICHIVKVPANISECVSKEASKLARQAIESVDGVGIFGVEMFLLEDDRIFINELAPRPHNSGHYTIDACITSQYENHLRAILGLPLGTPDMISPASVMVNLLGVREGVANVNGLENALRTPATYVHIYGKRLTRPGRKMGHVTALGQNTEEALEKAKSAASFISF